VTRTPVTPMQAAMIYARKSGRKSKSENILLCEAFLQVAYKSPLLAETGGEGGMHEPNRIGYGKRRAPYLFWMGLNA
jgi:hypothetical protein